VANDSKTFFSAPEKSYTLLKVKTYYLGEFKNPIIADSAAQINSKYQKQTNQYKYLMNEITRVQLLTYGNELKEALTILSEIKDNPVLLNNNRLLGYYYNVQGGIYFSMNKYLESREFYKTAYHFLLIDNDSVGMKGNLINIGNTFSITKELDSSLYYYELGEVLEKNGILEFKEALLSNLALTLQDIGRLNEAILVYEKLFNWGKLTNNVYVTAVSSGNLGSAYLSKKRYEDVIHILEYGLSVLNKNSIRENHMFRYYYVLSLAHKALGNFNQAYEMLSISDSLFKAQQELNLDEYVSDLKLQHKVELFDKETIIQEEKLRTEREQSQNLIIFLILSSVVIILILVLYSLKRRKNVMLVKKNLELTQILKAKIEQKSGTKVKSKRPDVSNEIIEKFESLFTEKQVFKDQTLSLEKLAKMVKTNRSYLSNQINDYYGVPFRSIVNKYRIDEARIMLISEEYAHYSIEGVALTVGYRNISTFITAFKKETGITPSIFRNQSLLELANA